MGRAPRLLLYQNQYCRFEPCLAPRVGVSGRASVGSGSLGMDANGKGPDQDKLSMRNLTDCLNHL